MQLQQLASKPYFQTHRIPDENASDDESHLLHILDLRSPSSFDEGEAEDG